MGRSTWDYCSHVLVSCQGVSVVIANHSDDTDGAAVKLS